MNQPRRPPRRKVDGVLLLDKPTGMTSNAALQTVRRLFNAAKAGHTGTLDPLATGLLPLCFGEATKFAGELLNADKSYRATLRFGVTTDTADSEGRVLETRPVDFTTEQLREVLADFTGDIDQVPPMYSALKRDGKPLYEYARAGVEIERESRRVTIHRLELCSHVGNEAVIEVDCSKGTYVRTLAADIGSRLACGAHLVALRRTRIGPFDVGQAASLDVLRAAADEELGQLVHPVDFLLAEMPRVDLADAAAGRFVLGEVVSLDSHQQGLVRVYSGASFLGLGEMEQSGRLKPKRLLVMSKYLTQPSLS